MLSCWTILTGVLECLSHISVENMNKNLSLPFLGASLRPSPKSEQSALVGVPQCSFLWLRNYLPAFWKLFVCIHMGNLSFPCKSSSSLKYHGIAFIAIVTFLLLSCILS